MSYKDLVSYVEEDVRKANSIEILRKNAKIGKPWLTLTEEDLKAY